jgi:hypothetical protein
MGVPIFDISCLINTPGWALRDFFIVADPTLDNQALKAVHESLNNVTPADVFFGKAKEVSSRRAIIKQETLRKRYSFNLRMAL